MLYKKSFDLNKDESQTRNSEKLYQPIHYRWCKFVIIPFLVGFILLLVLTNVDFNGDDYGKTWQEIVENNSTADARIISHLSPDDSALTRAALECTSSSNGCSLTCQDGTVNNMYQQLEPLYQLCGSGMILILKNCYFPAGKLKSDFFQGNFRLTELNIINCNLNTIADKAFLEESVKNLTTIYLLGSQFETLEPTAFEGLEHVEYFQMINFSPSWTTFKGYDFLKYFSLTLYKLVLQQQQTTDDVAYDPYDWLKGSAMQTLLMVNLSNNNFANLLNNQTFSSLVAIKELYLTNCSINNLPFNTFENIFDTLVHLDLSHNHLSTLPAEMLLHKNGLDLNLSFNYWNCTCENQEMLRMIQNDMGNINYLERESIKCYIPLDVKDVEIDKLVLECLTKTTLPIFETTNTWATTGSSSETDTPTTTSESVSTEMTEMETTETSGETNESYETTNPSNTSTTQLTTVTVTFTPPYSTTVTYSTSIKPTYTTTYYPLKWIQCSNSNGNTNSYHHLLRQEKSTFSIYSLSKTSVLIVLPQFVSDIEVFYFTNATGTTNATQKLTQGSRQQQIFSISITNLDSKTLYLFCLVQDKQSKISPFDCKGFAMPDYLPLPWILNDDQVWIICLVVLGICLMLLSGIIVAITVARFKKRGNILCQNENSDRQMPTNSHNVLATSVPLRNFGTNQIPSADLNRSQHQPPDVISHQYAYNNDSYIYEDLTI